MESVGVFCGPIGPLIDEEFRMLCPEDRCFVGFDAEPVLVVEPPDTTGERVGRTVVIRIWRGRNGGRRLAVVVVVRADVGVDEQGSWCRELETVGG